MKIWGYQLLPMFHKIKKGAIFVADAHINEKRDEFYKFLKSIEDKNIKISQLFLMGDIFDLLVGGIKYTENINKKYIDIINKISNEIEVFYFEGNHDFNLKKLFPKVKVFNINEQPQIFKMKDRNFLLLHGDKFTSFSYRLYTLFIRNQILLNILNFIDRVLSGALSKKILKSQLLKKICKKIKNFDDIVKKRADLLSFANIDVMIEGHFHQNMQKELKNGIKYINLPSFACNKSFFVVKSCNCFEEAELDSLLKKEK